MDRSFQRVAQSSAVVLEEAVWAYLWAKVRQSESV
jgi:hypothetical protein